MSDGGFKIRRRWMNEKNVQNPKKSEKKNEIISAELSVWLEDPHDRRKKSIRNITQILNFQVLKCTLRRAWHTRKPVAIPTTLHPHFVFAANHFIHQSNPCNFRRSLLYTNCSQLLIFINLSFSSRSVHPLTTSSSQWKSPAVSNTVNGSAKCEIEGND